MGRDEDMRGRPMIANRDAESALLGCMMRRGEAIDEACAIVSEEDFTTSAGRELFLALRSLRSRRMPTDMVFAAEELARRGSLDDCGTQFLPGAWEAGVTGHNAAHHARIVRAKTLMRGLLDAGLRIQDLALRQAGDAEGVIDEAEKAMQAVRAGASGEGPLPLSRFSRGVQDDLDARTAANAAGTPLCIEPSIPGLSALVPGFYPAELVILAGRPGAGKTAAALALLRGSLAQGKAALFCSLEMRALQVFSRFVAAESGVHGARLRTARLLPGDIGSIVDACSVLEELPLYIDDKAKQGMPRIMASARRLAAKHDLGIVAIDYAGLVKAEDKRAPRHEQMGQVSGDCKALAKELGKPVLLLAQLNRESEGRLGGKPRLSDLKGSGDLEQDCDTALLLHPSAEPGSKETAIVVAKQRDGATGEVAVLFDRETMRFMALPGRGRAEDSPF